MPIKWPDDAIIANSEFTAKALIDLGVEVKKIKVVHPGVDVKRFKPGLPTADLHERIGLQQGQQLLFSVGRLSRRKGFDTIIKCLPRLIQKGYDVLYAIAGIGEDLAYLQQLASDLRLSNRLHLLGHVSDDDLPRWYNAADVFVMPNREIDGDTEGFGMVF